MTHRIFVVDDHALTRRGYAALLGEEIDLAVVGEAESADAALDAFARDLPDLVVLDLTLGGMSGLELLKHLGARYPELPVLVVSMHDEALYGERVLRAGARGYVMKSEVDTVIVEAIRRVVRGGVYVSEPMSTKILMQYAGAPSGPPASPVEALSDRELEVFEHLGRGASTAEIAGAMVVSTKTVDTYRARIKDKLGLGSHGDLLRRAADWARDASAL
ncbi:response regulator transcription factor [Rubrivirga sp.]|uniref:response regulator transcription factor n=1 Tax=Rubrivirga sp. TaxID=1885344 RepID=UPI003B51A962